MPDYCDRASDQTARDTQAALSNIKQYRGESAHVCHECGAPIPEARRKAVPGSRLCRDCQEESETW